MKTVRVQDTLTARDLVAQAVQEPILLRDHTGHTFVLMAIGQEDAETLALADNPMLHEILERSRARAQREGWLTTKQLRAELGVE